MTEPKPDEPDRQEPRGEAWPDPGQASEIMVERQR